MYSVALDFKYSRFISILFFLSFSSFQLLSHPHSLVHFIQQAFCFKHLCLLASVCSSFSACRPCLHWQFVSFLQELHCSYPPPPSIYFSTDVALPSQPAACLWPSGFNASLHTPSFFLLQSFLGAPPDRKRKEKKTLPYLFFPIPVIPLSPTPPGLQLRPLWEGRIRSQPSRWRRLPALHAIPPLHLCLFSCLDFLPFRYNADGPPHIGFTA